MERPIRYRIVNPPGLVIAHVQGRVVFSDVLDHLDELADDSDFRPGLDKLLDFREVTDYDISPNESRRIFSIKKQKNMLEGRIAFVAPTDATFGMARFYQTIAEPAVMISVFRTIKEALDWLDLPKSILEDGANEPPLSPVSGD